MNMFVILCIIIFIARGPKFNQLEIFDLIIYTSTKFPSRRGINNLTYRPVSRYSRKFRE